jgi:SAM-dependent methyltransferase
MEAWPTASYRELFELHFPRDQHPLDRLYREHEELAHRRGERRWGQIEQATSSVGLDLRSRGVSLDIGCGLGSGLFALAGRSRLAIGLDILLSDLLIAKKRFAEAGVDNVAFVCCSALELPFREGGLDLLNAIDVIEHMPEQPQFLAETRRVLRPGGVFFFNSPNRYSLLSREPHVKLYGMGYLPRRWMEPYVRWRRGCGYRGKRLLSYFELRRMLRETYGSSAAVWPILPRPTAWEWLSRVAGAVAAPILPQHNVLAWKP